MADAILQEIKDKLDIVDVVGSYVSLKKSGTNFKGLCPFHHEKSGSFMVSPAKQIWHCFGCGEGGAVFDFVMKIENLEFREVLKMLAERAGVKLPEYSKQSKEVEDKQNQLKRINAFASEFYRQILLSVKGKTALSYLQGRGLTEKTIGKWQVGYAPEGFHNLEQALLSKGVDLSDLILAGVSVKNENGKVYDRFRERITFPIFNFIGECIGFSARVLQGSENTAKYINSPETPIYNKSKVLFGLNFAKNEIRKKDYCIIVEGQMDCIKLHQAGFSNAIATSGTALTEDQLKLVKRLSQNIMLAFDNDDAGKKAQRRALELALSLGLSVKVVKYEGVKDPDELVSLGARVFASAVEKSMWAVDYYLEKAQQEFTKDSLEQKKFVQQEVLSLVDLFKDGLEQEHYLKKVSDMFGISKQVLGEIVETKSVVREPEVIRLVPEEGLEKEMVGAMLLFDDFRDRIMEYLDPEIFTNEDVKKFFRKIVLGEVGDEEFKQMIESPFAQEATFMVELKLQEQQQTKEAVSGELISSYYLLRLNSIKNKLRSLAFEMKSAEETKNTKLLGELALEYQRLLTERKKIEGLK